MKDVRRTGEKSEDLHEFTKLDMRTYSQRAFSMFSGNRQIITIRFHNRILDTIVERFDAKGVQYSKVNVWYFKATAEVEVSDPFYGWLLGLGKHTKILYPEDAVHGRKRLQVKLTKQAKSLRSFRSRGF